MLQTMGGTDMIFLFEHMGKILEISTFNEVLGNIRDRITGQTKKPLKR